MSPQDTAGISRILAIETSCDDTSVAIVSGDGFVEACVSADQNLVHAPFGGVVPEIASRNHTLHLLPLIDQTLKNLNLSWHQIDGIAVTSRPGLIGSLLVGVITAKTLAQAFGKPLVGVNHLEGHILAPLLKDASYQPPIGFQFPFLSLAVSGGHTSLYYVQAPHQYQILGSTRDDAAGEAFDKFGQMLGLGFPGGVHVDRYARTGDPHKYHFPRSFLGEDSLDFSFSGLKSSASRLVQSMAADELLQNRESLCASFQESIVDVLIAKLDLAYRKLNSKLPLKSVSITGGVSANSRLRAAAESWSAGKKLVLAVPPLRYCTDNAAMIGGVGLRKLREGDFDSSNPQWVSLSPKAAWLPEDFQTGLVP